MAGTVANSVTGNDYLDGVLNLAKWDTTSLTFSFPTAASHYGDNPSGEASNNFEAFNATQIAAQRAIYDMYEEATGLTFTEITETDIEHADLRSAMSDTPTTAYATPPWFGSPTFRKGDAWYRNTGALFDNPVPGNYAWLTMLHETGHQLGLKHAHAADGSFPAMPSDRDWVEWTVMSYRAFEGAGTAAYNIEEWGYPATPMERDIAALQHLYGANATIRSGNTEYHINPSTGELKIGGVAYLTPGANRVLYALPWDTGGVNTLNLIDYTTDLTINLNAGMGSILSSAQLSQLRASPLVMADANLYIYSLDGVDTDSMPNRIIPGSGTDTVAGNGVTTLALTGNRSQYTVTDLGSGSFRYVDGRGSPGPNGTTTIDSGVILVEFANVTVTPPVTVNRHRVAW